MNQELKKIWESYQDLLKNIGITIGRYAELSMEEYQSAAYLCEQLETLGFQVERGLVGYPTSFVGIYERGTGGPSFGFLCEYDALPGVGDEEGISNGHGCGHNLFAASAVTTAAILKEWIDNQKIDCKLTVFGCPSEEIYGSKPYFARNGYFQGLDCIIGFHPLEFNGVLYAQHNAIQSRSYHFYGKASHAGAEPEKGISALDAVELMNIAANYMREHVTSDVRISYIIEHGGLRPNIVPDFASSQYNIRAQKLSTVEEVGRRLDRIAEGIAYAVGCRVEIKPGYLYANTIVNRTLAHLAYKHLNDWGAPVFTDEEKEYVKDIGNGMLLEEIEPMPAMLGQYTASTDEGDASWCAPWIRVCTTCLADGTPGHSFDVVKQITESAAIKGAMQTSGVICSTFVDLLEHPEILKVMNEEHAENTKGQIYEVSGTLPDKELFPNAPGIVKKDNFLFMNLGENAMIPQEKGSIMMYLYFGENMIGNAEADAEGMVRIAIDSVNKGTFTLKYSLNHAPEVLCGYYHVK